MSMRLPDLDRSGRRSRRRASAAFVPNGESPSCGPWTSPSSDASSQAPTTRRPVLVRLESNARRASGAPYSVVRAKHQALAVVHRTGDRQAAWMLDARRRAMAAGRLSWAASSFPKGRDHLAGQQIHRLECGFHGHPAPERPEDEVIDAEIVAPAQQLMETNRLVCR